MGGGARSRSWAGRWRVAPVRIRVVGAAVGFVTLWMVLGLGVQCFRTYTLAREAGRLEQHRRDLLMQNAVLQAEIQRLRTDDQYLERLAREQLGMLRPGEIELVIVPAPPIHRPDQDDPATTADAQPGGPLQSIRRVVHRAGQLLRTLLDWGGGRSLHGAQ